MSKVMQVHVRMERDGSHGWVAWVPELPGCVTEGRTEAKTKDLIAEAIAGYLEAKARHALQAHRAHQHQYTIAV